MDMTPHTLTREPRYIKRYYCPTELLRGESQGGRTERELIDLSDAVYLEKENAALRQALTQQAQRIQELETICLEAYQVVGSLAGDAGMFEHAATQKVLDNLSQLKLVHATVLPYPCAPSSANQQAQEVERLKERVRVLELTQCTSPWEDSPPCQGIQRQLDQLAAMTAERDEAVQQRRETIVKIADDVRDQLAASQARVRELESLIEARNAGMYE